MTLIKKFIMAVLYVLSFPFAVIHALNRWLFVTKKYIPRKRTRPKYTPVMNINELTPEQRARCNREIAKRENIPIFQGRVRHGYDLRLVSNPKICPFCGSNTKQHYANFTYSTSAEIITIFTPAGYFCSNCPTVIVDQNMINQNRLSRDKFFGVVSITDNFEEDQYFETWNGKKAVYVINKDGIPCYIASEDNLPTVKISSSMNKTLKERRKKQLAKETKKKSRGKKK